LIEKIYSDLQKTFFLEKVVDVEEYDEIFNAYRVEVTEEDLAEIHVLLESDAPNQ